jgi:hypothetical protein
MDAEKPATKTLEELCDELGIEEYTWEKHNERMRTLHLAFAAQHRLYTAQEINDAITSGKINEYDGGAWGLPQQWLHAQEMASHLPPIDPKQLHYAEGVTL